MKTAIKTENISKIYSQGEACVKALDGVSLDIEQGEFAAVVGNSGSGKSTLMNIIGCLDRPTHGSCYLFGNDVSSFSEKKLSHIRRHNIGFVFQKFNLISTLSAVENVELPMLYMGYSKKQRRLRAYEALAAVGLCERVNHKPSELSGGQQQRVAIARAISANPQIILADEPTGNLDSACGQQIMELLKKLNTEGKTVVLITHDEKTAAYASKRITVCDGKISKIKNLPV